MDLNSEPIVRGFVNNSFHSIEGKLSFRRLLSSLCSRGVRFGPKYKNEKNRDNLGTSNEGNEGWYMRERNFVWDPGIFKYLGIPNIFCTFLDQN